MNPKLQRQANRDAGNEALLLWAILAIVLIFVSLATPISWMMIQIGFAPLAGDIAFGTAIGAIVALIYYIYTSKIIKQAALDYNEELKALKAKQYADHLAKLKAAQVDSA